jgi:hypothetical protein
MSGSTPATRFAGARLGREIVFLDRDSMSLIHLDAAAASVWARYAPLDAEQDGAPPSDPERTGDEDRVCEALEAAGLLREIDGRYVAAAAEWL